MCGLMELTLLLAKKCPSNMVYLESSSPCMDTCSHLEVSSLCEEHYMDGCFCPEGTCSGRPLSQRLGQGAGRERWDPPKNPKDREVSICIDRAGS